MFDLRETNAKLGELSITLAQLGAMAAETLTVLREIRELLTEEPTDG